MPVKQLQKITVFAHHDHFSLSGFLKYLLILSVTQSDGTDGMRLDLLERAVGPSSRTGES